jgi:hypothetical protein
VHIRASQESQRNLYKTVSHESAALDKGDYDWFAELDKDVGKRPTTRTQKSDKYNPFETRRPSRS